MDSCCQPRQNENIPGIVLVSKGHDPIGLPLIRSRGRPQVSKVHGHQGTVGDLLQDVTIVSERVAHHDVIVLEEDLGITVLRGDTILDNDQDLIECPSHLLSELILGFKSEGGPNILSLSGKIATAGGISHLAGSHIEETAQRRVIGNLTGAATDQNIGAADVECGAVVLGNFGGSETGGKILEVGAIAKASDVVEI